MEWDYYSKYGGSWEDFGNYNYGATGAATGLFTLETLLREAGRAQITYKHSKREWGTPKCGPPYGDQPKDQDWIKQGWNDYWSGMYGNPHVSSFIWGVPMQYWTEVYSRGRQ
jgi:hypothetical protein